MLITRHHRAIAMVMVMVLPTLIIDDESSRSWSGVLQVLDDGLREAAQGAGAAHVGRQVGGGVLVRVGLRFFFGGGGESRQRRMGQRVQGRAGRQREEQCNTRESDVVMGKERLDQDRLREWVMQ